MTLAMMRLAVSPIPMGRTPEFLSRAIKQHAKKEAMAEGSTKLVQRRLATEASEWHKSREADLKEVHNLLQLSASTPDGPAAPVVFKAADRKHQSIRTIQGVHQLGYP